MGQGGPGLGQDRHRQLTALRLWSTHHPAHATVDRPRFLGSANPRTTRWGHGNTMAQGTVQVTHTGTSRWRRRTGEYASLAAALEAAADGDVLTVAPGTYRENLVLERAVTLRGPEGSPGSVRIAPVDGVPLTVRASAVVQDLHVEGQDAAAPALLVEEGAPELPDMRVVTRSAAGIEVRGGARPTVRRCTVDNPAGVGIAVLDGGGGRVRGVRGRRGRPGRRRGARRRPPPAGALPGPPRLGRGSVGDRRELRAGGGGLRGLRGQGHRRADHRPGHRAPHRLRCAPHHRPTGSRSTRTRC